MVHLLPAGGHDAHRVGPQDQPHEIKEMAAFLNKGAAGIGVEPVPVVNFLKEGVAMFDNAEHPDAARGRGDLVQKALHRRHVAIFHRHPDRRGIAVTEGLDGGKIARIGKERLFDQDRPADLAGNHPQLVGMAMVRAGDQKTVQPVMRQQRVDALGKGGTRRGRFCRRRHISIRFENDAGDSVLHQRDIGQMFAAHHAAADHPIMNRHDTLSRCCAAPTWPRPCRAMNRAVVGSNQLRENSTRWSCCDQPYLST